MSGVPVPPSLQTLLAAWHDSSHEKPRLLLLEGAAGIGKSHSLRAFAASGQNALVLSTACTGWLAAALRAFHPRFESERDPSFLQAARSLAPDVSWAQVAHAPALTDQNALRTALAQAFERLARRSGGLILLLEDAHDAGADDLGALRVLYRRALLGKAPILIALSARHTTQDLLEGFGQDAAIADGLAPERLLLSSLDLNGVTALLREHLHSEFLPDDLAAWLHARAEGHPLHTLELLRFLRDGGALRQAGTIWVFRAPSGKAVPRQLEAVLQARLLTVQADVQAWLGMTALAVIDRPVTVHEWSKLTRQNTDRIIEVANRLEHRGLLREGLEAGETVFSVAHPLYASLIRAQLAQPELERLHERSLEVCKDVSERARHARACNHPSANTLTLDALEDAQRRFAHSDVVGHAENLLAVEPGNITVITSLSKALFVLGETKRALEVSLGAKISDLPDSFEVLEVRFHILMRLGRYEDALETALGCQQDPTHAATGRLNQALALMHLERFDEARRVIDDLLLEFPEASARHGKALDILSDVVYSQGDLRASLEIGSRAANMLREFGDEKSLAITLSNLGGCCVHFGLWDQGREYLEEAITLFQQRGAFQHVMFARNNLGFLMVESGRYTDARGLLLNVCQQANTAKETRVEAAALTCLSDLEWQSNHLELAWRYHEQARMLEQRESADLVDRAHLEALRGNIAGALELVNAPQTPFHIQKATKRARIALLAGQYDRVAVFLDEAQIPENHATRLAQFKLLRGLAQHKLDQQDQAITDLLEAKQLAEVGGNTIIGLEVHLALALIERRIDDAQVDLRSLDAFDAGGHTLTVQALFTSEWALVRDQHAETVNPRPSLQRTTLRTLGSFALERDGQTTILRDSKARDLLAHLLVALLREDGPGIPRTQLIDAIWPESGDPEALEMNFRVTLKRLREKLGDAASVSGRDGIYELRDLNADVTHFLRALERLDFEAALGWYKGEFLANIDVTDAEIVRAQLWQRFRDTALRSSLEQPAPVAADLLEKLHRLEPLDVTLLERLTTTLRTTNDPFRLEQTLSRARTIFERETGEIPVELLLLERA
jgi:tetratricopeptide (TPR) repeat protein/DNA-binding SARP family transcriptional activator